MRFAGQTPSVLLLVFLMQASASAANHAVVLLYHHVDSDTPASTSVTPADFKRHLDYLWDNNFFVAREQRCDYV
jgi:hypothetical protein